MFVCVCVCVWSNTNTLHAGHALSKVTHRETSFTFYILYISELKRQYLYLRRPSPYTGSLPAVASDGPISKSIGQRLILLISVSRWDVLVGVKSQVHTLNRSKTRVLLNVFTATSFGCNCEISSGFFINTDTGNIIYCICNVDRPSHS